MAYMRYMEDPCAPDFVESFVMITHLNIYVKRFFKLFWIFLKFFTARLILIVLFITTQRTYRPGYVHIRRHNFRISRYWKRGQGTVKDRLRGSKNTEPRSHTACLGPFRGKWRSRGLIIPCFTFLSCLFVRDERGYKKSNYCDLYRKE